jgi:GAF domain-containing protein
MREKKVLPVLNRMSEKLSTADQLEPLLDLALDALLEVMETDTGWLLLLAPDGKKPLGAAWRGCSDDMKKEAISLAWRKAGHTLSLPDLAGEPDLDAFAKAGFASLIAQPLKAGPFLEFLGAVSRKPAAFNSESAEVLKLTASLIGAALEKGGFSRDMAELAAGQPHPPTSDMKEFERVAAIAGERYREVRQALEKAFDRARQIDKKFTQATIELLKETARWEDLLKQYEEESAPYVETAEAAETPQEAPEPAPVSQGHEEVPATPETAVPAPEEAPPAETSPEAAPEETTGETFVDHIDRMQAFRREHANL